MKRIRYFLATLTVICVASSAWLAQLHAKGPKGSGETPMTNPALVFLKEDATITIATADGQNQQDLTGGTERWSISRGAPTWSPDGKMIAYLEAADNDNPPYPKLYVMNADGSNPFLVHMFDGEPFTAAALCATLEAAEEAQQRGQLQARDNILGAYGSQLLACPFVTAEDADRLEVLSWILQSEAE